MPEDATISALESRISALESALLNKDAEYAGSRPDQGENEPAGPSSEGLKKLLDWHKRDVFESLAESNLAAHNNTRELRILIDELYKRVKDNTSTSSASGGDVCVPNATTYTSIGAASEGSETALTTTWTRTGDMKGVDLWAICRVVYNHSGDKKLYAYARKMTFNSCGILTAISAETRYEVDPAETC